MPLSSFLPTSSLNAARLPSSSPRFLPISIPRCLLSQLVLHSFLLIHTQFLQFIVCLSDILVFSCHVFKLLPLLPSEESHPADDSVFILIFRRMNPFLTFGFFISSLKQKSTVGSIIEFSWFLSFIFLLILPRSSFRRKQLSSHFLIHWISGQNSR